MEFVTNVAENDRDFHLSAKVVDQELCVRGKRIDQLIVPGERIQSE